MTPWRLIATGIDRVLTGLSPVVTLTLLGLVVAIATLLVFRRFSDQAQLARTKNAIKARLLEVWLFRDDMWTVLSAQARLLGLNARYLRLTLKPMAVLLVPTMLLLAALDPWFGLRPLRPGESATLSVRVEDPSWLEQPLQVTPDQAIVVETPPLRIPTANEIAWRIRARSSGAHTVRIDVGPARVEKQVVVGDGLARVSSSRWDSVLWQAVLNPRESPLASGPGVTRVEVHHAERSIEVLGWPTHWLVFLFLATVAFVFALKRRLGVEV
jgi:hypothetical protein